MELCNRNSYLPDKGFVLSSIDRHVKGDAESPRTKIYTTLFRLLCLCVCGLLLCASAWGLDRDRTITQFHHTNWTAERGAPDEIRAIAQTNDGYLWLGTANGLYRFDGLQFEHYRPRSGALPANIIYALLATSDGGLWISYLYGGASFLKDGNLTNYGEPEGLPPGRVKSFAKDREGVLWAAVQGGLARLVGSRWERIGMEWNFPWKEAQSVFVDKEGTLWVTTEGTVVFLPLGSRSFQSTNERTGMVLEITQAPDGAIWMADMSRSVRQLPLPGIDPHQLGPEIQVGSKEILFDRDGALWVTSVGDGIRRIPYTDRFRRRKIAQFSADAEIFTEEEGLSGNYVWAAFEDREGNIWIGTGKGLDRFRASDFVPVRFPPGAQNFGLAAGDDGEIWTVSTNLDANRIRGSIPMPTGPGVPVNFVSRDQNGAIWMSTSRGVYRWKANKFTKLPLPFGQLVVGDSEVLNDRNGVLWVYTDRLGLCQFRDGAWSRYDRQEDLPTASPITGAIDSLDRKWFGYAGNKVAVIDGTGNRTFSQHDGLQVGDVKAIQEQSGRIWVGGSLGLAVYDKDRFRMLSDEGAEALLGVSGIVATRDGSLWLNASRGVIHIPAEEVRLNLENPAYGVRYRVFDSLDGVPGSGQQQGPFPTVAEGSDGRLWFSTGKAVTWIDPNKILTSLTPPPVMIRSIYSEEKSYDPSPSLILPGGTTSLQIDFTALSLSIPERIVFRYKLEGVDSHWQESGTRRQAFYNSLAPGRYEFRVIASNQDGIWNETGATLGFSITPMFYQTIWFRTLIVLLAFVSIAGTVIMLYRWRLARATERLSIGFEERLAERTRIAHELHDTLLQGFFAAAMRLQGVLNLLPERSEKARENLDEVLDQIDCVLEDGRRAIWDINALSIEEAELGEAFSLAGEDLIKAYGADFGLTVEGEDFPLYPAVRDQIYRIGREALINAFRHSKASKIEVEIEYASKHLRVTIRDDGCGISPDYLSAGREGHLGLSGMREQAEKIAAELNIWSRTQGGTEVELIVPSHVALKKPASNGLFSRIKRL